ncbi:MAG: DUF4147 domain-containing protein [Gemmatimonadaceae bacterium]|nr:DUF4147 domain-containing protein [Gemmatimonadaceae bacterium]
MLHARPLLEHLLDVALQAADPRRATARVVAELPLRTAPGVIAIGKAAAGMALGALDALAERGLTPTRGVVVSHTGEPATIGGLPHLLGSHPLPDERSRCAAETLAEVAGQARRLDDVLVLVSGGTTSLVAQAIPGSPIEDLRPTFDALLRSGLAIQPMNLLRRRLLRWGAGRLAAALAPAHIHCLIVSDVMGSDLASIGSGPCVRDPATAEDVRAAFVAAAPSLPSSIRDDLGRAIHHASVEPPVPGGARFDRVQTRVILENRHALAAVREAARAARLAVIEEPPADVSGEAADVGVALARSLAAAQRSLGAGERRLWIGGGEPTVTIPAGAQGRGGRCQELALACALEWHALGARSITLLAAGTDGRDGPTDAAGAVVDAHTIDAIRNAGRDPRADLRAHDSGNALDAAGALLLTGPTGTNVNDVVLALIEHPADQP